MGAVADLDRNRVRRDRDCRCRHCDGVFSCNDGVSILARIRKLVARFRIGIVVDRFACFVSPVDINARDDRVRRVQAQAVGRILGRVDNIAARCRFHGIQRRIPAGDGRAVCCLRRRVCRLLADLDLLHADDAAILVNIGCRIGIFLQRAHRRKFHLLGKGQFAAASVLHDVRRVVQHNAVDCGVRRKRRRINGLGFQGSVPHVLQGRHQIRAILQIMLFSCFILPLHVQDIAAYCRTRRYINCIPEVIAR